MRKLIVVNNPRQWTLAVEGAEIVAAKQYLTGPAYAQLKNVRVFNLCRSYGYQSKGYYVSLLAEARSHAVVPDVRTIQDLKTPPIVRIVSEELDDLIAHSLRRIKAETFDLSIYFGENMAQQHLRLAKELYKLFPAPLMRARFVRGKDWALQHVRAISLSEVPPAHQDFLQDAARRYFSRKRYAAAATSPYVYDLAILTNPEEPAPPSDKRALQRFAKAAERQGFSVEFITRDDYSRLGEFDALFIRETTNVNHHTYRFARRAQSEGMAVIDAPEAILRCTNKVYLAEVLRAAGLPAPQTVVVDAESRHRVAEELGLPCVLKLPDGSFSHGVVKAKTEAALQEALDEMLDTSELVVAQAYMPTDFDWRIGILDGEPLYACKYYMAKGHWQIYNWSSAKKGDIEGAFETLPLDQVPARIVKAAQRAVRAIGSTGLFGVDLKDVDGTPYIIEVNDNPSIDTDVEDAVLQDELYARVIAALKRRVVEKSKEIEK